MGREGRPDVSRMSSLSSFHRLVFEWAVTSERAYSAPFIDVIVEATVTGPSGAVFQVPGFYDGNGVWRVRFSPNERGRWHYRIAAHPANPDLAAEGTFEFSSGEGRGYLRATPGDGWGFADEAGDPVYLLGDTVYHLFGMAYCGLDVALFLRRRAAQGFNLFRVRLPVSLFHPPEGYNQWQTRRTWPWGGSEQSPRFDQFNLEYFRVVDEVVRLAEELGVYLEMIMEGWGFEFPFNSRQVFTPEWEELWLRYLIARYDASPAVGIWTPMNEYEYYPNGDWHYVPIADRWAMRTARWIKRTAPHGHVVAIHNGPTMPPFADRFRADPEAIDAIMFQTWGTTGADDAWLAVGIEDEIDRSLAGWNGSALLAEYGYERNPAFDLLMPVHEHCGPEHTRRGAWRGAFRALGVIHGFENSWGPWAKLDEDQPGLASLLHLYRFLTEIAPFHTLRPAADLVTGDYPPGHRPLALATPERDRIAVYLPTGGEVRLALPSDRTFKVARFDPRTGALDDAEPFTAGRWRAPSPTNERRPDDWVLLLTAG